MQNILKALKIAPQDAGHGFVTPPRRLVLRQDGHGQGIGKRPRIGFGEES